MFNSVRQFENYLICNPQVDIALIILMKCVFGYHLLNRDSEIMSEHLETIQAYYGHLTSDSYEQWVEKTWEKIGPLEVYAEGPFVDLYLIPKFFETICYLVQLVDNTITSQNNLQSEDQCDTAFYIILEGEHYNIIYPRAHSYWAAVASNPDHLLEGGEHEPVNYLNYHSSTIPLEHHTEAEHNSLHNLSDFHQLNQTFGYHEAED